MFPVLQHVDDHIKSLLQLNSLFRVFPRSVEPGIQRGKKYISTTRTCFRPVVSEDARTLCGLLLFRSDCVL